MRTQSRFPFSIVAALVGHAASKLSQLFITRETGSIFANDDLLVAIETEDGSPAERAAGLVIEARSQGFGRTLDRNQIVSIGNLLRSIPARWMTEDIDGEDRPRGKK